jgi:hypothetical protein
MKLIDYFEPIREGAGLLASLTPIIAIFGIVMIIGLLGAILNKAGFINISIDKMKEPVIQSPCTERKSGALLFLLSTLFCLFCLYGVEWFFPYLSEQTDSFYYYYQKSFQGTGVLYIIIASFLWLGDMQFPESDMKY